MTGLTDEALPQEARSRALAAAQAVLHQPAAADAAEAWQVVGALDRVCAHLREAYEAAAAEPWLTPAVALLTRLEEAAAWWTGQVGHGVSHGSGPGSTSGPPFATWDATASSELGILLCELDALAADLITAVTESMDAALSGAALGFIPPASVATSGATSAPYAAQPTPPVELPQPAAAFLSPLPPAPTPAPIPAAAYAPESGYAPEPALASASGYVPAPNYAAAPDYAPASAPAPVSASASASGYCPAPGSVSDPAYVPAAPDSACASAPDPAFTLAPAPAFAAVPESEFEFGPKPPFHPEPEPELALARLRRRAHGRLLPSIGLAAAAVVGVIGGITFAANHAASGGVQRRAITSEPVPFTLHNGSSADAGATAPASLPATSDPASAIGVPGNLAGARGAASHAAPGAPSSSAAADAVLAAAHGPRRQPPSPRHAAPRPLTPFPVMNPYQAQLALLAAAVRAANEQATDPQLRDFSQHVQNEFPLVP